MAAPGTAGQPVDQDGLYREPFLVVDPGMHTAIIRRVDSDSAGRFLVTGSDDKTLRIWSAEDGRLQRTIRIPAGPGSVGQIYAVAMSPDGGTIAAGGWTNRDGLQTNIYLFERVTGRQIGRIGGLPNTVTHLAFSPDDSKLAAAGRANGVRLFDAQSLQQIAEDKDYGDLSCGIAFAPDGLIAATSFDGKIRLYGPRLVRKRTIVAPHGKRPFGIAFSPDGSRIAVGYDDTTQVTVLDGSTLGTLALPDIARVDNGNLITVAWSADGKLLYAGGCWQPDSSSRLRAWDEGGRGVARDYALTQNTIMGLRAFADGRLALAAADPRLLVMDRSGSVLWQAEPRTADFRDQQDQLRISPDGALVRCGFAPFGKSPARFDLRQRRLDADPPSDATLAAARSIGLDIKDWKDTFHPTLAGKPLELAQYERSRSLAVTPDAGGFLLGTEWSVRRFDAAGRLLWRIPVPGTAWAVNITADGRIAVAAYGDGTIRWHRMTDGEELLAFFPHRDGTRWVAWTPLGHYIASPGGEDLIQWQINHGLDQAPDVYTASRFRDQFYRPDVIDLVLAELDPQKALEAADRASGKRLTVVKSIAEETPPRVAIIDPADGTFVGKSALSVAYTVEDRPGTEIRRVRLLLDGAVVGDARNLTVPASGRLKGELNVTLQGSATTPTLELLAESAKGSSDPATIRIRRNASDDAFKPTLYVLAVGVSRFKNAPRLNLSYADADATDFAALLKQQERGLYSRVVVETLVNEEATGRAILSGFQSLERNMSSRDVAAVFISTHGANDANREFYLLPHDVEPDDEISMRFTGVPYDRLRGSLGRLSDKGKTMVFLDARHSGNILSGTRAGDSADIDRVAADLASAETGVIVFSSSTGRQFSIESPEFGHGYFTQALLEAFEGKSDCPPPWLRVGDLQTWLAQRVKKLSNGAQTPMTTVPFEQFTNWRFYHVATSVG